MKVRLLITTFALTVSLLKADSGPLDSLLDALSASQDIEAKIGLHCDIASIYRSENLDSAFHYAEAGYALANKINSGQGIAQTAATIARLYVSLNNLDKAGEYYAEAANAYLEADNLLQYTWSSMRLGNIQLAQSQYFEALQFYESCLPVAEENNFDDILPHLYNNIGVIFLELRDYDEAVTHLEKAYEVFELQDDSFNSSHASNNLAYIYHQQGNDEKALNQYIEIVPVYIKQERWTNLADLYNSIATIYRDNGDFLKANEHISFALNILETNRNNFSGPPSRIEARVYLTAANIKNHEGDFRSSNVLARRSLGLATASSYQAFIISNARLMSDNFFELGMLDSALTYGRLYIQYQDSIDYSKGIMEVSQLRMQNDFESKLRAAELESIKKNAALKQRETLYIGSIIGTLMLVCIMVLLFVNQRKKAIASRLRRENLELAQAKLRHQVDYKNKELTTNMMYLSEKNEFITMIARKLEGMKTDAKRENRLVIQKIINELRKNTDNSSWTEFEMRFMEVHADFYAALNTAFPDLTPNEKRLCAFLRLNMTTKEISAITHQSAQSINMARFRLRKKMNMERDENLISYLDKL